jgi:hypothetical protein
MSSTVKLSKAASLARLQAIIAGTQKHLPKTTVSFGNAAHSTDSLVQLFQSLKDALAARHSQELIVVPMLRAFEHFLQVTFSSATETLADFGLAPPKARKPMTTEAKAAAAAKRRATRKLLGTKGTLQKKQAVKAAESALPTQTTLPKP